MFEGKKSKSYGGKKIKTLKRIKKISTSSSSSSSLCKNLFAKLKHNEKHIKHKSHSQLSTSFKTAPCGDNQRILLLFRFSTDSLPAESELGEYWPITRDSLENTW